ncbi:uncharacterized protein KIAA0825 homolog [Brachionichthys hirsutus]|uniref:uncharacterized protein KIAA0825 homolog n=1 Tax=Brachionichthys hirsutus TaxID=412623 RepID=UPI003604BB60
MACPGNFSEDQAFTDLLVPGVSNEMDFEQLQIDVEEKLQLSPNSGEQQPKELQNTMTNSRAGERPPADPSDCLRWFNLRIHDCFSPVVAGHDELMDFLTALQHYLTSEEEGKEEATLQLLLNVSDQCGVCFPRTPSSTSSLHPQLSASSIHLVHTVKDNASLEIQEAWDDVRLQLRRHLLDRLSSRGPERPGFGHVGSLSVPERIRCLQQLLFLYPESEVLTHYQHLRSRSVMGLLSVLSSSPGGETGFDRLALSLHSVVLALTQALTEELHILSRLAELHTILAYLNTAYLSTVARELATSMEKEYETALRDNTTLSGKIKKYSAKSRASVAPLELPMKNRTFSLTSHQLRALTQLACTLLGFEKIVKKLVANTTFAERIGGSPSVKGILKKRRGDSHVMTDDKNATAETHLYTPKAQALEFDWRSAFRELVPHMAHCVKVVLDDACLKSLQQEAAEHSLGHNSVALSPTHECATVSTCSHERLGEESEFTCERETPRMIAKFCGAVTTELDALLPLAAACRDGTLLEVRSSFVEACGRVAFALLDRLQERALEVPSSAPLKNLPALLATCIHVCQRLQRYHATLKDSNVAAAKVRLTLLPIQKCQNTLEELKDQLTSYCIQVCLTCILQDEESHQWANPKPFYEGERSSFSVQMWFYFLCGLRSDLWAVLPAGIAKEVLGQVLSETLQLLVQRYAEARPSYQRHLQIRCDITALLLYVEHLMWSLCESPEALLHPNPHPADAITDWPSRIHSQCEQLVTVLVVVTAPLSLLHRIFMTDLPKAPEPREPSSAVAHWLNAINPELFTERVVRDGLEGQAAARCQLRLLTSDPGLNPRLLLRTLLHQNCHLPRTLLENSHFCQSCLDLSTDGCEAGDDFIVALFNLFSCLNNAPKALTHVLQPYLEKRARMWDDLYTLGDTTAAAPVVISCVRATVSTSAKSLLVHVVSMVTGWQASEEPSGPLFKWSVPEGVLEKIPKKWKYAPLEARGNEPGANALISLTVQTLSFILTNLPLAVASVPLPVRYLFLMAEKQLSQHSRQLRLMGLLIWALLGCLIQSLEDPQTLEQISGLTLDMCAKEPLSLLAECLQAVMGIQQKGVPKPSLHKVLQTLEEKRPKWTSMQLQKARKLCSDSVVEEGGESRVAAAELTEQKIGLMLLEVCHKAGGSDYLRQIYHIIQGNEELLMRKLGGSSNSLSDNPRLVNFDFDSERLADAFNPLHQFDHIGKKKLDQSAVISWAWDWPRLLPAYLGMSRVTFRTLLANRWEMQNGAEVDDGDQAMVEGLRRAHLVCCCSPGPQDPLEADETQANPTQGETAI